MSTFPQRRLTIYIVASTVVIVSVLIMAPVLVRFRQSATPFDVRKAASTLITDGPYRFSRNPTYLSLTMLYLGIGLISDPPFTSGGTTALW